MFHNCSTMKFDDDAFLLFLELSKHKNVRNIFYQNYTKISMENIINQISSKLIHKTKLVYETKLDQLDVYYMLHLLLQYEDFAMQIIDEIGDDIVVGIFDYFFTLQNSKKMTYDSLSYSAELLFSILERLAKRKKAIIIKHVHFLLQCFFGWYDFRMWNNVSKLVRHQGIARALITQEEVELLVDALKREKVEVVPLVLQCLFFENEEFAYKVIARGGWRMMTKGMQLRSSCDYDMFQFSLMHIAREMASKGEIQELVMEIINKNDYEYCDYCLTLLISLVTCHVDIMREEFIAKGVIRFLLACLASLEHDKKWQIITSGLLQKVALDIKGVEEMMAHNGIQVFIQLLLNDDNVMYSMYIENIVDIIQLLVKGLEDPMKLLMSSIDDIDVLEIHKTFLRLYGTGFSFLPETLDVDSEIAKKLLNSLSLKQQDIIYLDKNVREDYYRNDHKIVNVLIKLSKHVNIASQIMAKEGILEAFVIQLSKDNLSWHTFELLQIVLRHEKVAVEVVQQRPSFIKELLHMFPMERLEYCERRNNYNVASLLFILAKHDGFIKFIVESGGIKIFLKEASLQNWNGRCDVIKVLVIMAENEDYALQIEKAGGSKMLLKAISCYLQYVHDKHLETLDIGFIMEYEDDCLVMCCLETFSHLVHHAKTAKQISTRKGNSQECGIIALIDVMQNAAQLWSSITLVLRESVVSKKLIQIKGHMLTILSTIASTLTSMAKSHPHIDISRKVNENVLKGIFQLEGMVIGEHQELRRELQDLLDIKKFHLKDN